MAKQKNYPEGFSFMSDVTAYNTVFEARPELKTCFPCVFVVCCSLGPLGEQHAKGVTGQHSTGSVRSTDVRTLVFGAP